MLRLHGSWAKEGNAHDPPALGPRREIGRDTRAPLAFVAFSAQPGTEAKIFATALGGGILLDATLIRGVLVPAVVAIVGRWNWWLPGWAARLLRVESSPLKPAVTPDPTPETV